MDETYENLCDQIVSELNNFMEEDHQFWCQEFGCGIDEIVDFYGFGYTENGQIYYLSVEDMSDPLPLTAEELLTKIQVATTTEEKRDLIFSLFDLVE